MYRLMYKTGAHLINQCNTNKHVYKENACHFNYIFLLIAVKELSAEIIFFAQFGLKCLWFRYIFVF